MSSSVDVIVPCYRYGHFLRQCVESVLSQDIQHLRVLIIDDASPDNTSEVAADLAREDGRVRMLRHASNKGHIQTYNEGIAWAAADYMLILSADDYLLPGALSRSVTLMEAHSDVGLTCGRNTTFTTRDAPQASNACAESATGYVILHGIEFISASKSRNIVSTPTAVVRTQVQKLVGHYRPELPHAGDMEMWFRFAAHSSIAILDCYQAVYRRHPQNMSLTYLQDADILQRKAAIDSFIETCRHRLPSADRLHRKLLRALGCDAIGLASSAFNRGDISACEELSDTARLVCPDVTSSWPWTKLAWKRRIGLHTWRILEPVARIARLSQRAAELERLGIDDDA